MTYGQWIQYLRKNLDSFQYSGSAYHHKVTSAVLDAALASRFTVAADRHVKKP